MKLLQGVVLAALMAPVFAQGCSGTKPCESASDCGGGEACLYAIGSCSAQGECKRVPDNGGNGCGGTAAECGAEEELCGCNGAMVITGCGYPGGYANGPTTGAPGGGACVDAGSDGGGSVEAGESREAGEAGHIDGAVEGGETGDP